MLTPYNARRAQARGAPKDRYDPCLCLQQKLASAADATKLRHTQLRLSKDLPPPAEQVDGATVGLESLECVETIEHHEHATVYHDDVREAGTVAATRRGCGLLARVLQERDDVCDLAVYWNPSLLPRAMDSDPR
jgi:hypothetical protein